MIRVLLADDHEIMRDGLVRLLQEQGDITVVGVASNGAEAVELARKLHPDVAVLDINMPRLNGIDATRAIKTELPDMRIIGLSMYAEKEHVAAMREAGAETCLDKAGASSELLNAIHRFKGVSS